MLKRKGSSRQACSMALGVTKSSRSAHQQAIQAFESDRSRNSRTPGLSVKTACLAQDERTLQDEIEPEMHSEDAVVSELLLAS